MSQLHIDLGTVTVTGEVLVTRNKYNEKNNSWQLDFDITDNTGTIKVYKFMFDERYDERYDERHGKTSSGSKNSKNSKYSKSGKIVGSVKKGMYLTVSGALHIDNRNSELYLVPRNIFPANKIEKMDLAKIKRVELHLHTNMSASDALPDVSDVIKHAHKWGHPAVAITDHGVVQSFPKAAKTISELKLAEKIKVIYGMEGYLKNEAEQKRANHIILLAKNRTGLKNLYKLVTKSHLEHFDRTPIILKSELISHRDGIIIGSACERGELFEAITQGKTDDELIEIAKFYDYLEIQPLCNNMFMILGDKPIAKNEEDLRNFNRKVVEIGRAAGIPTVATCDVHFINPTDEIYRKIIMASKGFKSADEDLPLYFRTTDEMLEELSYLGAETAFELVVTNTNKVAEMCEIINPLPAKQTLYAPKIEGSASELINILDERLPQLYGENPPKIVTDRAKYELDDILNLNYDVIYMTAQKLVKYLKDHHSRVGSRGSVGSSFVAYLAGITEVNPLAPHYRCPICKTTQFPTVVQGDVVPVPTLGQNAPPPCGPDMPNKNCPTCAAKSLTTPYIKDGFNIPFETFMGFGGEKIPDIDLNISGEHQSQAHKFIYDMFGTDHVFRAGTINTLKGKNAYNIVKKYLETTKRPATAAEINRLTNGCLGVKSTTGQHPGGLTVIPQDMELTDFCPAQYPADDSEKGVITLHFEYKYLSKYLLKLDILGHANPTMLKMLEDMTGIDADDIDLGDPDTLSIFRTSATLQIPEDDEIINNTGCIGIPEFGTPFVRQLLKDTNPDSFDTLVRISGYSHGEKVWLENAQDLITSKTAKVSETISSRDDIMLYLISKGMTDKEAFKISESVRNGDKIPQGFEPAMRDLGVPAWYIDSCNKISYLFPKAHAVAYVIMSFRIAWFKVHRPLAYYSAHFYRRSRDNAFDAQIMTLGIDTVRAKIREYKNLDEKSKKYEELIITLESCYEFYMRGFSFAEIDLYKSDPEKFLLADEKTLRPPFIAIAGLGETAAKDLAESRKGRVFISLDDIHATCTSVNRSHIESLKNLGALGDLPTSSQMSLF